MDCGPASEDSDGAGYTHGHTEVAHWLRNAYNLTEPEAVYVAGFLP